jgi:hypothetical protein
MSQLSTSYEHLRKLVINIAKQITLDYKKTADGDGRIVSAILEKSFLDILEDQLTTVDENIKIERPTIRHWYDIMIDKIPVNLKITVGGTDNAFNKTAITHTILGYECDKARQLGFSDWYEYIRSNYDSTMIRDPYKEYHYLVINKHDPSKVIFKSILDVHSYKSNPSNVLQIHWNHEFEHDNSNSNSNSNSNITTTIEYHNKKLELLKCIQTSLVKEYASKRNFIEAEIDSDLIVKTSRKRKRN